MQKNLLSVKTRSPPNHRNLVRTFITDQKPNVKALYETLRVRSEGDETFVKALDELIDEDGELSN